MDAFLVVVALISLALFTSKIPVDCWILSSDTDCCFLVPTYGSSQHRRSVLTTALKATALIAAGRSSAIHSAAAAVVVAVIFVMSICCVDDVHQSPIFVTIKQKVKSPGSSTESLVMSREHRSTLRGEKNRFAGCVVVFWTPLCLSIGVDLQKKF